MTPPLTESAPAHNGTRVMIVEGDAAQARLLARLLTRQRPDLTVVTSNNGAEAIRVLRDTAVDLILTDLTEPGCDGFELLAWAASHRPEVPVFAMSAFGDEQTRTRVGELGALAYFPKPIDVKSLVARLTSELSRTVRGHVHNVSLASFLQLMEMDRKTCTLTVTCAGKSGTLIVRKGELVHAQVDTESGEAAAIAIVAWPNPSIAIDSQLANDPRSIDKPLGFILMEAMRIQDEVARDVQVSEWPPSRRAALPLPAGVSALAIVDTTAGAPLHWTARDGFPIVESSALAASLVKQEVEVFELSEPGQQIEEFVLLSATRCQVIRPLSERAARLALVVCELSESNLVVARQELARFVFACGQ